MYHVLTHGIVMPWVFHVTCPVKTNLVIIIHFLTCLLTLDNYNNRSVKKGAILGIYANGAENIATALTINVCS